MSNYRNGKVCYTNGKVCKYLLPVQIKEYENLGWWKGTLRKRLTEAQRLNISNGTKKAMNTSKIQNKLSRAAKRNANKERFLKNRRYNWHIKTPHEEYISDFMESLNFKYEPHINIKEYKELNPTLSLPNFYKPDYANLDLKIAIELDGKNHTFKNKELDDIKDKALNFYGFKVYRFKNKEIYKENFKDIIFKIISESEVMNK